MRSTSTTFQEGYPMSESSVPARSGGDYERLISFLKNLALVVTIVGAVPTAITAYRAYTFGVPFSEVPQRLAQYDLWVKNIDCQIDYKALSTAEGTRVDVGACPKTGDIALKLSSADGKAAYQWIAYDELQKPGEAPKSNSFIDLLISAAKAEETARPFVVAQAMEVVCQSIQGKNVVRVVKEGGKCYKEIFSPMKGTVEKRDEVACSTPCG
ncbi:MAG: hypothetical protein ACM3L9_03250 [Deltaproteobacteria bacterium]